MPFHFSSLGLLAISALPLLKNYFRDAPIFQFLFIKLEEIKVCKNHIVPVVSAVWMKNLMVINGLSLIKISHMCKGKYSLTALYMFCFCTSLRMLPKTLRFVQTYWWKCLCFLNLKMWQGVLTYSSQGRIRNSNASLHFSYIWIPFLSLAVFFQTSWEQPSDSLHYISADTIVRHKYSKWSIFLWQR